MAIGEFLYGSPGKMQQVPRFTPQQTTGFNELFSQGLSQLQSPQSQFNFAPIAQKATSQFNQKTIPTILSRLGSNAQSSSALNKSLGAAGSNLQESLAALESQFGLQKQGLDQQRIFQMLGLGGQPQFENTYQPGTQGLFGGASSGLGQILGMLLPMLLGGGFGGAASGGLGALASQFGGR